jgi:glycosyltransferase involved in cell wall biosynthesis/O-antigen/teichoic acid export membrane protein
VRFLRGWRLGGGLLVGAIAVSNLLNFVFNAYLGRVLAASDFSVLSLISSVLYLTLIPMNALQWTASHQAAYLETRDGAAIGRAVLLRLRRGMLLLGLGAVAVWLVASPWLSDYFRVSSRLPIALFAMVPLVGFALAVDRGRLSGYLLFGALGLTTIAEPLLKLGLGITFVRFGWPSLAYVSVPLSVVGAFGLTLLLVRRLPAAPLATPLARNVPLLEWQFFLTALLSGFSAMSFLTFDVLLAKHFLAPEEAGQYALISLVGKIIYFLGTLSTEFLIPFVSRAEGEKGSARAVLGLVLIPTLVFTSLGFFVLGLQAPISIPILFGEAGTAAVPGAPWLAAGAMCFAVTRVFVGYHLARRQYALVVAASALVAAQIALIVAHHATPLAISQAMAATGVFDLTAILLLHLASPKTSSIAWNLASLAGLFRFGRSTPPNEGGSLRILVLNWRDTRHKWAGGAEVYVQELAARWVRAGMHVTLFCGTDRCSPAEDTVNGVEVVRRGGFFTVYAWSAIYYVLRFKRKFDVIVDCENGIPFFSPFYARIPVVLLVFHVHQEVFTKFLPQPFAGIASFLEGRLMPVAYRRCPVVTISNSSRDDISAHGLSEFENIRIVHPGVDTRLLKTKRPKASYPLFTYLGRLKPYKHVDMAIRAFAMVVQRHPEARLAIAGDGECREGLTRLAAELGVSNKVEFLGKVSEERKATLLAQSWGAVQPSMVEGWGITVIEANACGVPVIAHDVSGLRDAIVDGQTGRLVQPMNVPQFAQEMVSLIEDAAYRNRLQQAATVWARRFDWDRSAESFAQILSSCTRREAAVAYLGPTLPVESGANPRYVATIAPDGTAQLEEVT